MPSDDDSQLHTSMLGLAIRDNELSMIAPEVLPSDDVLMRAASPIDLDLASRLHAVSEAWYEENVVVGGWLTQREVE